MLRLARVYGVIVGVFCGIAGLPIGRVSGAETLVPEFKVDTTWPQLPLPNNWTLGGISGVAIGPNDHIWVLNRPRTLEIYERAAAEKPPIAACCVPAPAVIEFDPAGKVVRAWGGPGPGYDWPAIEHGLAIDHKGNVWIGGNSGLGAKPGDGTPRDGMVLKFSPEGKFLMQIGHAGVSKGSLDPSQLGGASNVAVDAKTNEVFISDGYLNNRVIVFDADTGAFKRLWGAYGKPPTDRDLPVYDPAAAPDTQFRLAHCIKMSKDGLLYVCDFNNNRIQIFHTDGTFVGEYFFRRETLTDRNPGTAADVAFWPDAQQTLLFDADTANNVIHIVRRSNGKEVSSVGHYGMYAGQLARVHQIAVDSKGNLYVGEVAGRRVQKFTPQTAPQP